MESLQDLLIKMIIGNNTPCFPEGTDYNKKKELAKVFHEQANVVIAKVKKKYCEIHVVDVFNVISVMQILTVDYLFLSVKTVC